MSDDLISRKTFSEKAKDYFISPGGALRLIESQPTAYDVDKVIEQLENLRDRFDSEDFHIRGILEKAIKIVKTGGVADD